MKKELILLTIIILFTCSLKSQNGEIQGTITDITNNEPIPFANVVIAGTQIGTTSDFDGNFSITGIDPGYIKLQVSYVGYEPAFSADVLVSNNNIPFVEIHVSNVYKREPFRHHSYLSDKAEAVVCGLGGMGYDVALDFALENLKGDL